MTNNSKKQTLDKKAKLLKQLEANEKRELQIKARLKDLDQREKTALRKKETRAKVILGGFIISQMKKNNAQAQTLFEQAIKNEPDRNKKVLLDYQILLKSKGKL